MVVVEVVVDLLLELYLSRRVLLVLALGKERLGTWWCVVLGTWWCVVVQHANCFCCCHQRRVVLHMVLHLHTIAWP